MSGYSHVFQRMDETIADVCLRELDWETVPAGLWNQQNGARARISEVYSLSRPLILHLLKADKSPMKNMKKLSIARSMMDAGKKNLEAKNIYDALNMYNKAVVFAPNVDDNLGKACAERAGVLILLGDYKRALTDIEQAEQCEYQFEKRFELEERKGLAYLGLNQPEAAKVAFQKSILLLEDAAGFLHKKFVERKMKELNDNLKSCIYIHSDNFKDNFKNMKKLPELKGRNKKYPALSEKVDIVHNSTQKAALFCLSDLSAGDILGLEKPIASFLQKDYMRTNCWHCLVTIKAPYGCPLCSAVKFCSRECLQEACSTYHPSECLLTDIIVSNRIESWPLAFRAVAGRPLKQTLLVGRNGASSSSDLSNLVNLATPTTTISQEDLKKRSLMSVFYLIILQMTGYFDKGEGGVNPSLSSIQQMKGKENDSSLSDDELHIATLIDKIISVSSYCTTDVCHFEMKGDVEWTGGKVTSVIGKTMNPTLTLVNHSCYPSAARVCFENKTMLVAQKNMRSGDAVTINYSAPFYAASRSDRQEQLSSSYLLDCSCAPCTQNWPLFDFLPPGPQGLADQDIDIRGFTSSIDLNGVHCKQPWTTTEQSIMDTLRGVKSKLDQIQRSSSPGQTPSKVMIQNQVRLFRCLLAMYSSKIKIVKTEYGSLSIPV